MRGAGREALGDGVRLAHEILVVNRAIDHADGLSLLRRDRFGQHHQRPGARVADEARQDKSAARVRNEADAGERLQELSRLRREHDVAGKRDIGAGSRRRAVDRAYDGLRQIADPANDRIEAVFERCAEVRPGVAGRKGAVGEVRPGAKAPSGAGNKNRPTVGLCSRTLERSRQPFNESGVERIQALGPVEGQRQHAALELIQESRLR